MAAEINAQLEIGTPSTLGFEPISIPKLRERWLEQHEHVRRSSLQTIRRYRAATRHLVNFVSDVCPLRHASDFRPKHAEEFVRYLRSVNVAPNGHENACKRPLKDCGIKYILETCSALFNYWPCCPLLCCWRSRCSFARRGYAAHCNDCFAAFFPCGGTPMKRSVHKMLAAILIIVVIGCSSSDDRLARMAMESTQRQAEQNREMSQLNREVAEGTKRIAESIAVSRGEMLVMEAELQKQRLRFEEERRLLKRTISRVVVGTHLGQLRRAADRLPAASYLLPIAVQPAGENGRRYYCL